MQWLFERTIEIAAWVAMIVAWISAVLAAVWLVRWFGTLNTNEAEPWGDPEVIWCSAKAAAAFVASSIGLGVLACIDRFVFDVDEKVNR